MGQTLRVLIIEDQEDDAELILRYLRKSGYSPHFKRCDTVEGVKNALTHETWDLILSDYNIPGFNVRTALAIVREINIDIPFIIVSGAIGEETAVELMKSGAHDYILKSNLARLVPAFERELREVQVRSERKTIEEAQKFISEASATLSATLEYEATVHQVVKLMVPKLGDWSYIRLSSEGEFPETNISAYKDSEVETKIRQIDQSKFVTSRRFDLIQNVIKNNRSLCVPSPDDMSLRSDVYPIMIIPIHTRGKVLGTLSVSRLSLDQKYTSKDLSLLEELGRRAALAIDNARLYKKAQEAIQLREEFLSIASHEFKTPLTALKMQIQMLLRQIDTYSSSTIPSEKVKYALNITNRQADRLVALVDEFLDSTKLQDDSFELHREEFDISSLIQSTAKRVSYQLVNKPVPIHIEVSPNILVYGDPMRTEQVISNLLSNAIKYGANQPIEVKTQLLDYAVRIEIIDHGIGIPKDKFNKIFERFERAISPTNISGLGLGLYISNKIISKQGGRILVESELGKGSKFIVELPIRQENKLAHGLT